MEEEILMNGEEFIYIPKRPLSMHPQAFVYSFRVINIIKNRGVWMNIVSCDEKTACGIANRLGWEYSEFENLGPEQWVPLAETVGFFT